MESRKLQTPALIPKLHGEDYTRMKMRKEKKDGKDEKVLYRNMSQGDLFQSSNHRITFDNVIKRPEEAYKQSAFTALMPELMSRGVDDNRAKMGLPVVDPNRGRRMINPLPPGEQWKKDHLEEIDAGNRKIISIFDSFKEIDMEQYERMPTVKKLQISEMNNQNLYKKFENQEPLVVLNSDNYLGTLNCILHCLLKALPLRAILKEFETGNLQRNEGSKYEGVAAEVMSGFFKSYFATKREMTYSGVKVMRLLELMNLSFKSFYKRDPFDMLTFLINGLHDDLNQAPNRYESAQSYPAFENQGIVELDYIQAERWDKFFKKYDDSPILDMFQGQILKSIQCQLCYAPKLLFENFTTISLPLKDYPKEVTVNITELIVDYFQKQKISGEGDKEAPINSFYCMKCRKNAPYKKEVSIWRFPRYLTIQVHRFEAYVNKVNSYQHNVFFPVVSLDLRKFATVSKDPSIKKAVYNLYGTVQLAGFLNANRFNASVYNQREDRWYLYEENEKVSHSGVESPSKAAYILFYQRIDALQFPYIKSPSQ